MDPVPSLAHLTKKSLVEERLKAIAAQLIAARRQGRLDLVTAYARQAGLVTGQNLPPNLFTKTIHVYHPDRLAGIWDRIDRARREADGSALADLARFLELRADRPVPTAGAPWDRDPDEPEPEPEDPVWDSWEAEAWDTRDEDDEGTFLGAVGRELFSSLARYPGPSDLASLTGELDLSYRDLFDLEGIGHCRGLIGLNLAGNQIDNVFPIKDLLKLEFLDLAENDLEDADALSSLVNLRELDLSANDIDDVAFLDRLPQLRTVDLTGNPVRSKAVLARLEARGVMVIL